MENKKQKLRKVCFVGLLFNSCSFKGPSFYKPKLSPISEYELFQNRPRPYNPPATPYPRDTSAETAARKAEFQQKLTAAAQQLNPAPPSVLLVSIESSNNWYVFIFYFAHNHLLQGTMFIFICPRKIVCIWM